MGKKSNSTSRKTVYSKTTTSNPYAYAATNNSGTISGFQDGALKSVYNFVNNSIDSLLDEYLNPNLNSTTNQAKLNSFMNNLNQTTKNNLENSIINPLSQRNMLRSSQAADLYRNLSDRNISEVSNYVNELLSSSQDNTAKILSNLLSYYMQGANYLAQMQSQSLNTSMGNSSTYTENGSNDTAEMLVRIASTIVSSLASKH